MIAGATGLTAADVAWLLGHAGGAIVVVRPAEPRPEADVRPGRTDCDG